MQLKLKPSTKTHSCKMVHIHPDHMKTLPRLNRAAGQIRGVSKMIEERRYCVDILTQLKAVQAAIRSVEAEVQEGHIRASIQEAFSSKNQKTIDKKMKELINLLGA